MANREHIDDIVADWQYEPGAVIARRIVGSDGRDLLQMRIDMGLLQMECQGRPDGARPEGAATYYDYLAQRLEIEEDDFVLKESECQEVDREFVQFYHRRVCWLALREFHLAVQDADHTLSLMDLSTAHAPQEEWAMSHEQYRPFVLFHRTQAAALAELEHGNAEAALDAIAEGLTTLESLYEQYDASEQFSDDELAQRLREMQESIRDQFEVGQTLREELSDAIAAEDYEGAARLRDEIARRSASKRRKS